MEHLVFEVKDWSCSVPVTHVAEISRPLPTTPVANGPLYLMGLATLRGTPTPVLEMGVLLRGEPLNPTRFIRLRGEGSEVALAVSRVGGVFRIDADERKVVPALLAPELLMVEGLGLRDQRLMILLDTLRLLAKHGQPVGGTS